MSDNEGERETIAKLEYTIDSKGDIYIDIAISDYSNDTIKKFGTLLASIPTTNFEIQTLSMAKEAFLKDNHVKEFDLLIEEILNKKTLFLIKQEANLADRSEDEHEPLIKPTDLII